MQKKPAAQFWDRGGLQKAFAMVAADHSIVDKFIWLIFLSSEHKANQIIINKLIEQDCSITKFN